MQRVPPALTQLKILKLGGQDGLDILGVDRDDVLAVEHAHAECRYISAFLVGHVLHSALRQLGDGLHLVRGEALFQSTDTEQISGISGNRPTSQLAGILSMLDSGNNVPHQPKRNGSCHQEHNKGECHGGVAIVTRSSIEGAPWS